MGLLARIAALLGTSRSARALAESPAQPSAVENEGTSAMRAAFPFPVHTVPGAQALAQWERLKAQGQGWPVIVGDDEALERIMEQFSIDDPAVFPPPAQVVDLVPPMRSPKEILAAADAIDITAKLRELFDYEYGEDPIEIEPGEWPDPGSVTPMTLTVDSDILSGRKHPQVHIVVLPTSEAAAVPAYLRWGGWNACPVPEVHVALHRKWARDYGAEIVGISGDVINVRAARRPATRDEAMALAHEQFLYCSDIVLQGTDTMEPLAMSLIESDWWYFWWD